MRFYADNEMLKAKAGGCFIGLATLALAIFTAGAAHAATADPASEATAQPPIAASQAERTPHHATEVAAAAPAAPHDESTAAPVPPETTVVTHHTIELDGHSLKYTATAGNLLLRNASEQPTASVFYVAYTAAASGRNAGSRPLTFLFNGGPGAGSIFLMIGSVGVKRVRTDSPAATPPAPYDLEDNPDSLLDKSDLVFVDAVGTGLSRVVGRGTGKAFWGVDEDLNAYAHFIERYLTINQRWNSPKFLFGESYGTTRAAMLAYRLGQDGIQVNGVVLLSSILNFGVNAPGYDLRYVNYLPSFAAIAWYHDKIVPKPPSLPAFVAAARAFATGPYAAALARGDALPDAERDAVAERMAYYTGLDVSYIKEAHLRISLGRFRKQLLRGESRSIGRYDARFEGRDFDDAGSTSDDDASVSAIGGAFKAALEEHLAKDLHYQPQSDYRMFNDTALRQWNWKHHEPWGETLTHPYAAGDLATAMRQNPHLMVLSANGYFDLATPFAATEYDLSHMGLDAALRANLTITHYPAGHMVYLDDASLHAFKGDLANFYDAATNRQTPH